jgi:hypothetical protein
MKNKISKKELEKLVMEGLMKEIGPKMAAKAVGPALSKGDPRSKSIAQDAITSMFSKYIGRKMPFNFIARDDGSPVEYELVEVLARINWVEPEVEFHFYNSEGVESDKPFALNKKNIVITYDIKNDELKDSQSGRFHWILNPFTSKFLAKASNEIREMYYTAMPEEILDPQEDKYIIDPNFKMKSKINKNDFKEFSYDSKAMSLNEGKDTGNPFDLNNSSNLADVKEQLDENLKELQDYREKYYDKIIDVWTYYCGQRANDAGVSNDNRAILYSLLESGEFDNNMVDDNMASQVLGKIKEKINHTWTPVGLHQDKNGTDFYTNNPEDMEAHLQKMGYKKGGYTLSPGAASKDRFEQPYTNPDTREGSMSLNESEIRKIVRRALK